MEGGGDRVEPTPPYGHPSGGGELSATKLKYRPHSQNPLRRRGGQSAAEVGVGQQPVPLSDPRTLELMRTQKLEGHRGGFDS